MIFHLFVGISPKIFIRLFWPLLRFLWKFCLLICPSLHSLEVIQLLSVTLSAFSHDLCFWVFWFCSEHVIVTLAKLLGNPKCKHAVYFYFFMLLPNFIVVLGLFFFFFSSALLAKQFLGKLAIWEGFLVLCVWGGRWLPKYTGIYYCLEANYAVVTSMQDTPETLGKALATVSLHSGHLKGA